MQETRTRDWGLVYVAAAGAYLAALALTDARFMGDTIWYIQQIEMGRLFEAGHLLWRPVVRWAGQALAPLVGGDQVWQQLLAMIWISGLAGLLTVLAVAGCVRAAGGSPGAALVAAAGCIATQGFINYSQTGSSYAAALGLVALGLLLALQAARTGGMARALVAGAAGAGAALFWLPMVLVLPAIGAAPVMLGGMRRWPQSGALMLMAGMVLLGSYLAVLAALGIRTPAEALDWMSDASRGNTTGGVARAVYGFARSFLAMGDDGLVFKRLVYGDPYNPVQAHELLTLSFWKLALFYGVVVAVVARLVQVRRGALLALLALAALPALAFAVRWQGGDMERYMALYPFIWLAVGVALSLQPVRRWVLAMVGLFVVALVGVNGTSMNHWSLARADDRALTRLGGIEQQMPPASRILTLQQQDDVWQFNHTSLLHPANRQRGEFVEDVPETRWRARVAAGVLLTWQQGGEQWISTRLLAERPQPDWNWVESVERPTRSWADVNGYFRTLDYDAAAGGDDGFVRVAQNDANLRVLQPLAAPELERLQQP